MTPQIFLTGNHVIQPSAPVQQLSVAMDAEDNSQQSSLHDVFDSECNFERSSTARSIELYQSEYG